MAVTPATYPRKRNFTAKIAIADVNSGSVIVPAAAGRTLIVTDYSAYAVGGTATQNAQIQDTNGTPVVVGVMSAANLVTTSILRAGATGATFPYVGLPLTPGKGLKVIKSGTDIATATHLVVSVDYVVT